MIPRGRLAGALAFAGALALSPAARADDARERMRAEMTEYFRGEQREALVFLACGAASAGIGGALISRPDAFPRSTGITLGAIGAVEIAAAAFYYFSIDGRVRALSARIDADPGGYRREELARIHGVSSRFVLFRFTEIGLIFGGAALAAAGAASDKQALRGVGLGLAIEASTFLLLDGFAEERAHVYTKKLEQFSAKPFVSPLASSGVLAGWRGVF